MTVASPQRQRKGVALPFAAVASVNQVLRRGMQHTTAETNGTVASGNMFACPMMIPAGASIDQINVHFNTVDANKGTARLGVYDTDEVLGGPGSLLAQLGTCLEPAAAGVVATSVSPAWACAKTGLYWIVLLGETQSMDLKMQRGSGLFTAAVTSSAPYVSYGYKRTGISTGSLPATFGAGALTETGPKIITRILAAPPACTPARRVPSIERAWPKAGEYTVEGVQAFLATLTTVITGGDMVLTPIFIEAPALVKTLSFTVTSAASAGATGKLLIYDARPDNYPNRLLFSGSAAIDSTGLKSFTVAFPLAPGLYWLGVYASHNVTLDAVAVDGTALFSIAAANYPTAGIKVTANAPDPFSGTVTDHTAGKAPSINVTLNSGPKGLTPLDRYRTLPATWPHLYVPGWYTGPGHMPWQISTIKIATGANTRGMMMVLDRPMAFDRIHTVIGSFNANVTFRFGLYANLPHSLGPGALLYKFGTVAMTAGGLAEVTIDIVLQPGIYWPAVVVESGDQTNQLYMCTGWAMQQGGGSTTDNEPNIGWSGAAGLPDPAAGGISTDAPVVGMRVKSYGG